MAVKRSTNLITDEDGASQSQPLLLGLSRIANTITANCAPGRDATGGHVTSLTESVMGVTAGLCEIASAINRLAEAIESRHEH